jgi:hypothetical protein
MLTFDEPSANGSINVTESIFSAAEQQVHIISEDQCV